METEASGGDVRLRCRSALVALVVAVDLLGVLGVGLISEPASAVPAGANGRIAFVYAPSSSDVYTMNADGSDRTRITQMPGTVAAGPQWSPDGTKIAFAATVAGQQRYELFTMNADGSELERVVSTPSFDLNPAWSPDGTRLLFERASSSTTTLQQIWMVNVDGTGLHAVSDPHNFSSGPTWSPDGNRIAFDSSASGHPGQIVVANPDGSGAVTVSGRIPTAGWRRSPSWSPDGTRIVLSDDVDNVGSIWVMNADGTDPRQLTANPYGDTSPVWSPDASQIAFSSRTSAGNFSEIFTIAADGSARTRVSDNRGHSAEPDWQRAPFTAESEPTASTAPAGTTPTTDAVGEAGTTPTEAVPATTASTGGAATGSTAIPGADGQDPTIMASGASSGDVASGTTANGSSPSTRTPWLIAGAFAIVAVSCGLALRVRRR